MRMQSVVENGLLEQSRRKNSTQHADMLLSERDVFADQNSYASPPAFQADTVATKELTTAVSKPAATLVSPPTSLADEMDIHDQPDGEGEHASAVYTPSSGSRHSSRQPRQVERYIPEVHFVKTTKPTTTYPQPARRSSFGGAGARKITPGLSSGQKKSASRPSSSHGKKSLSPSVEKKSERHSISSTSFGQYSKVPKPERANLLDDDDDPDAESLRLIRELQEQEFSLRRRAGRT